MPLLHCGKSAATMAVVRVQCYSGSKPNERPIRFEIDGHEYMIDEVIEQCYRA